MAAPPPQSQPPALMDELVEEILLRFPSDKPAQLVRAALVCNRWCRLVTDPGFRRRFHLFHRTPPMLGLVVRRCSPATTTRFLPTSSFYPYDAGCRTWSPLDARHGRILFYYKPARSNPARNELNVWTPAIGEVHKLPKLWLPCSLCAYWNAALLYGTPGCNYKHMECPSDGPFTVVLVGGNIRFSHAYVYSLEADEWSQAPSIEDPSYVEQHCTYSALVGNALYFRLKWNNGILEYDLAKKVLLGHRATADVQSVYRCCAHVSVEDDGLGFAMVHDDFSLCIWLRESAPTPSGGWTWTRRRVVDLKSFLPSHPHLTSLLPQMLSVFLSLGLVVMMASLAIDLKSGRVRKVSDANGHIENIIPYISFCTPALRASAIDEGPSMGASNMLAFRVSVSC